MKACSREYCSHARIAPDAEKISSPTGAEGRAVSLHQQKFCHPDRSEAEWRDLQFHSPAAMIDLFYQYQTHHCGCHNTKCSFGESAITMGWTGAAGWWRRRAGTPRVAPSFISPQVRRERSWKCW